MIVDVVCMVLYMKCGCVIVIVVLKMLWEMFVVMVMFEWDGMWVMMLMWESLVVLKMYFGLMREFVWEWMCLEDLLEGVVYDEKMEVMRIGFDAETRSATVEVFEYAVSVSLDFVFYDECMCMYDELSGGWGGLVFLVLIGIGCGYVREFGASVLTRDEVAGSGEFNVVVFLCYVIVCMFVF